MAAWRNIANSVIAHALPLLLYITRLPLRAALCYRAAAPYGVLRCCGTWNITRCWTWCKQSTRSDLPARYTGGGRLKRCYRPLWALPGCRRPRTVGRQTVRFCGPSAGPFMFAILTILHLITWYFRPRLVIIRRVTIVCYRLLTALYHRM